MIKQDEVGNYQKIEPSQIKFFEKLRPLKGTAKLEFSYVWETAFPKGFFLAVSTSWSKLQLLILEGEDAEPIPVEPSTLEAAKEIITQKHNSRAVRERNSLSSDQQLFLAIEEEFEGEERVVEQLAGWGALARARRKNDLNLRD